MDKKAMELSINFIVILIISLVIFTGSIYLTKKFFKKATNIKDQLDKNTEDQIHSLLSDGSKVAVPINRKTIKRGNSDTFGLGIYNILREKKTFQVFMTFSKAYDTDGNPITLSDGGSYINSKWVFSKPKSYELDNNDQIVIPLLVKVDGKISEDQGTQKGTYVFNVCVCNGGCSSTAECTPAVTPLYGGSLKKIYVTVP